MSSLQAQFGRRASTLVPFLPEMIHDGVVYSTDDGVAINEPRAWMRDQGVNVVRLRGVAQISAPPLIYCNSLGGCEVVDEALLKRVRRVAQFGRGRHA